MPRLAIMPEIDATFTIRPDRRSTISPPTIFVQTNALVTLRSSCIRHVSPGISSVGTLNRRPPTLFTRTSIGPCSSTARRAVSSATSGIDMSPTSVATSQPSPTSAAAAASSEARSRPTSTRSAPACASPKAISLPKPRLPPVTIALRPARENASRIEAIDRRA
jgi:hypothetical protein